MKIEIFNLIVIMILCGFAGGLVNYFMVLSKKDKIETLFWRCVIVGTGASFLVPLFLEMISSDLINKVIEYDVKSIFVFVGFCLVASIFSRRFIVSIGEKLLKELAEAKQTATEAKEIAIESKNELEIVTSAVTENDELKNVSIEQAITSNGFNTSGIISEINSFNRSSVTSVLNAFDSKAYTFRSASGIAKEISLPLGEVKKILNEMVLLDWVYRMKNSSGQDRYALTLQGKFIDADLNK